MCTAERDAKGRDELTVAIESRDCTAGAAAAYRALLKARLGVEVQVALAAPGALAALTGLESRQKPARLIDKRFAK